MANRNTETHTIPVRKVNSLNADVDRLGVGIPINVYRTEDYVVVDAGLPRCRPENIRATLAPGELLIQAERHPGQALVDERREYLVAELPYGAIERVISLPEMDLASHAAEAHFRNGMLVVTIPTRERDAYLHGMHGEETPEED